MQITYGKSGLETGHSDAELVNRGFVLEVSHERESFHDWSAFVSNQKVLGLSDHLLLVRQVCGASKFNHNGFESDLVRGDYILLDPDQDLGVSIVTDCAGYLMTSISRFTRANTSDYVIGKIIKSDSYKAGLLNSFLDYHNKYQFDERFIADMTQVIFISGVEGEASVGHEIGVAPDYRYTKILEIIESHASDHDFNLNRLAEILSLSRRQLQREFSAHETSFTHVLTQYRLEKAKRIFQETLANGLSFNITNVAHESGFGDVSNFNRVFKKHLDKSPSDYLVWLKNHVSD